MADESKFSLTTVYRVYAEIRSIDDKELLFTCNIISLSTAFRINTLPECSCVLYPEVPAKSTYDKVISDIISKVGETPLRVHISIEDDINSKHELFDGIITEAGVSTNMTTFGSSSKCISIRATHYASVLFLAGTAGMVYAEPKAVFAGNTISKLILDYKTDRSELSSDTTIGKVMTRAVSNNEQELGIADIFTLMIRVLKGEKIDDKDAIITTKKAIAGSMYANPAVIRGTARMARKDQSTEELIKVMLTLMYTTICSSTIGDGLLAAILRTNCGLIIAPRETSKIWIVPDVSSMRHSKEKDETPEIPASMILSMVLSKSDDPYPNPVGVLLTKPEATLAAAVADSKQQPLKQGDVIIATYPANTSYNGLWVSAVAPRWLATDEILKLDKDNKLKQDPIHTAYAKTMFDRIRYKNNGCSITTDARGILAFKALGMPCIIRPSKDESMIGRLDSYGLTYSMGSLDGNSSLGVSLAFTYVRPFKEDDDNVVNEKTCMYNIKMLDSVTKFPVWPPEKPKS